MYTKDIDILPIYNYCVSTVHVTVILLTKFLVLDLNHLKGIKSHLFQLQSLNHLDNKTNIGTYLNSWDILFICILDYELQYCTKIYLKDKTM